MCVSVSLLENPLGGIICATARDFLSWKRYAGTSKLQASVPLAFSQKEETRRVLLRHIIWLFSHVCITGPCQSSCLWFFCVPHLQGGDEDSFEPGLK